VRRGCGVGEIRALRQRRASGESGRQRADEASPAPCDDTTLTGLAAMVEIGPSADYKLALGTDRNAAIALSSSVAGVVERREPLGDVLRGRIAAIHRAANPALGEDEAAAAAVIVNQVMKMIPALAATEDERAERLVGEARKLMALYIAGVLERPSAAPASLGAQLALGRGWPSALARRVKPEQY
jgi:hypothetical protein